MKKAIGDVTACVREYQQNLQYQREGRVEIVFGYFYD